MTDNQAAQMVETLDKIEKHLQAIDWKFWDMYQRFSKEATETKHVDLKDREVPTTTTPDVQSDLESLAEVINESNVTVKHSLKYPSIEILKNE